LPNTCDNPFVAKKRIISLNAEYNKEGKPQMPYCKNCGYELPEGAQFCPRCGTPVTIEEPSPPPTAPVAPAERVAPEGLKCAFWWQRFVAWIIDVVIVSAVTTIIGFSSLITGQPFNFTLVPGWPSWLPFFLSFNLNAIILFLYWLLMEGAYGQSFGKMAMRIKVVRTDGSCASVLSVALESVGKAFFLFLDVLLGWILYPKRRQRIFNVISDTIVIKVT
jgi:uncharacterized RDD family membrane protein YckC